MTTSRRTCSTVFTASTPSAAMKVAESARAACPSGDAAARAAASSSSNHMAENPSNGALDCSSRPTFGLCT